MAIKFRFSQGAINFLIRQEDSVWLVATNEQSHPDTAGDEPEV
jgi:hypothetical protein